MKNHPYICMMKQSIEYIAFLVVSLLLVSCYTATESTPRIKVDKDIIRRITAEEAVMDNNFVEHGCHTWLTGKTFTSVDSRLSPVLRPEDNDVSDEVDMMGKNFVYCGFREDNIYGNKDVVYLLFDCEGSKYSYYTGKSMQEIETTNYQPLIPSLVDMDVVAMARSLFVGKTLYIKSNRWYNPQGELMQGRQLVSVRVTGVEPGNNVLPLAISYVDERDVQAQVYITTKSSSQTQMLTFDRLFSYDDPRLQHPDISDEVWKAITEARLMQGMTKVECRLAIGTPSEVKKIPTYSGLKEQWLYNSGAYLFFSDGVLEEFRQ